uniref:Uncharacterized protein n=1 Tax=Oryza punctata TaxID=4537 RepID=A0A0E0MPP1_ORYPU
MEEGDDAAREVKMKLSSYSRSKGEDIGESATETEVDYDRFMNSQAPDFATILSILKGRKGMKHCNRRRRLKDPDSIPHAMNNTGRDRGQRPPPISNYSPPWNPAGPLERRIRASTSSSASLAAPPAASISGREGLLTLALPPATASGAQQWNKYCRRERERAREAGGGGGSLAGARPRRRRRDGGKGGFARLRRRRRRWRRRRGEKK